VRLENMVSKVISEATAGRWGGPADLAGDEGDRTGEKR
jgi:hypothetical protein